MQMEVGSCLPWLMNIYAGWQEVAWFVFISLRTTNILENKNDILHKSDDVNAIYKQCKSHLSIKERQILWV